tara:strand:+ start:701 stop:958 length:258 start_codon:yes stop_codon:yes gene_type:complete
MKNITQKIDLELTGDNLDEYTANQEAELAAAMNEEVQIVEDDELKSLLQELWQEEATAALQQEEEYTERDAFDDFYNDYANEMEG